MRPRPRPDDPARSISRAEARAVLVVGLAAFWAAVAVIVAVIVVGWL